jgi:hypothetical protein
MRVASYNPIEVIRNNSIGFSRGSRFAVYGFNRPPCQLDKSEALCFAYVVCNAIAEFRAIPRQPIMRAKALTEKGGVMTALTIEVKMSRFMSD